MLNKFLSFVILGIGVIAVFFIIQNTSQSSDELPKIAVGNNLVGERPFLEPITDNNYITDGFGAGSQITLNLTDTLLQQASQKIIDQNPGLLDPSARSTVFNAPDIDSLTKELTSQAQANFNPKDLWFIIDDKDIKIGQNDSGEAIADYIQELNKLMSVKQTEFINKFGTSESKTMEDYKDIVTIYNDLFKSVLGLTAPKIILSFHKRELELLKTKSNIFNAIMNYQNDPLYSIIALGELDKVDQQFKAISEEFKKFMIKNNLQ